MKTIWKPGAMLAPVPPALITCGTLEEPNIFTAAWTGIVCTNPAMTYVSVRPQRHSYGLIERTGSYVVNLTTARLVRAADFCGVRSGRDIDKFKACNLTAQASSAVGAPSLADSPLSIECAVEQVLRLGSHDMFLARIMAVAVDSSLIDANGRLCLDRAGLAAYAHGSYFELGRRIGTFGFSVRKKPAQKKQRKK